MRGFEMSTSLIVMLILGLVVLGIMLYAIFAGGKTPLDSVIASSKLRSCCESLSFNSYSTSTTCGKDADGNAITASQLADQANIELVNGGDTLKEFCTGE